MQNRSATIRANVDWSTKPEPDRRNQPSGSETIYTKHETNKATSRAQFEDMVTQRRLEADRGQPNDEPIVYNGVAHKLEPTSPTSKGPLMIGICRTSGVVPPIMENILHLENLLVMNDCYAANRQAEQSDPNRPIFTDFGVYDSLVFNGEHASTPFPIHHSAHNSPAQGRFITLLQQADMEGREVILLIRNISGHSIYPNVYERIHQRFPSLVVRIVYALRPTFDQFANCCQ